MAFRHFSRFEQYAGLESEESRKVTVPGRESLVLRVLEDPEDPGYPDGLGPLGK